MEPLVGRWPWPRLIHATVIDYLAAAGAKVIGYDILFAERDIRKFMVADTEWTGELSDAVLVDSTKKAGNVVHIAEASERRADRSVARVARESRCARAQREAAVHGFASRDPPSPAPAALAQASSGIGQPAGAGSDGPCARTSPRRQCGTAIDRLVCYAVAMAAGYRAAPEVVTDEAGHCVAMIPWRGPVRARPACRPSRRSPLRRLLLAAANHGGAEARHRSRLSSRIASSSSAARRKA